MATESTESASARATTSTLKALDTTPATLAAWALTADSSLLVTEAAPPELALTRLDRTSWMEARLESASETALMATESAAPPADITLATWDRSFEVTEAPPGATLTQAISPGADCNWRY